MLFFLLLSFSILRIFEKICFFLLRNSVFFFHSTQCIRPEKEEKKDERKTSEKSIVVKSTPYNVPGELAYKSGCDQDQ